MRRRASQGFAMMELMIAIAVLAIIMAAVAMALNSTLRTSRNGGNRSIAANLAAAEMDRLRGIPFDQVPTNLTPLAPKLVDSVNYAITDEAEWVTKNATAGPCDVTTGAGYAYLRVNVTVRWPDMAGALPVTNETLMTPPVGTFSANTGHIGVKVTNRDTLPQSNVTVYLNDGTTTDIETTNSDGCAFWAFKPVGNYSVYLNTPGFVETQGVVTTPTQTLSVVAGVKKDITFTYDEAATLAITLRGADPTASIPGGLNLTLRNAAILPKEKRIFPGSGPLRTIPSLFPFADGYQVWAGGCLDADPEGRNSAGVPYWPAGLSRGAALTTTPGSTVASVVQLQSVRLQILSNATGNPVAPGTVVTATHDPDTGGDGCTAGETLNLGTTDSTGRILFTMPFGLWKISAGVQPVSFPYGGAAAVNVAPPADHADITGWTP